MTNQSSTSNQLLNFQPLGFVRGVIQPNWEPIWFPYFGPYTSNPFPQNLLQLPGYRLAVHQPPLPPTTRPNHQCAAWQDATWKAIANAQICQDRSYRLDVGELRVDAQDQHPQLLQTWCGRWMVKTVGLVDGNGCWWGEWWSNVASISETFGGFNVGCIETHLLWISLIYNQFGKSFPSREGSKNLFQRAKGLWQWTSNISS